MRRVGILINHLRKSTENEGSGIATSEFLQYLNDAQERLQSQIFQTHPESDIFAKQGFIDITSGTASYDLETLKNSSGVSASSRILSTNAMSLVERSDGSGSNDNYYPLQLISNGEKSFGYGYILRDNVITMVPEPNQSVTNGVRLTFFQKVNELDVRRGKIASISDGVSVSLTTSTYFETDEDMNDDWFSIVDLDGNVIQEELRMEAFDNGTGVITCSTALNAAVLADATDYYVCLGKHTKTHSEMPPTCERYLLAYVEKQIAMRDSSIDSAMLESHLIKMELDIVALFATNQNDAVQIPITSTDMMIW